ncbi:hypothetical protein ACJX0J_024745 [Zea mays]
MFIELVVLMIEGQYENLVSKSAKKVETIIKERGIVQHEVSSLWYDNLGSSQQKIKKILSISNRVVNDQDIIYDRVKRIFQLHHRFLHMIFSITKKTTYISQYHKIALDIIGLYL